MKRQLPHSRRPARSWDATPVKRKRGPVSQSFVADAFDATRYIPGPDFTGHRPPPILDATQAQPGPDFTGAYQRSR